jgi:hypothetical protein
MTCSIIASEPKDHNITEWGADGKGVWVVAFNIFYISAVDVGKWSVSNLREKYLASSKQEKWKF